MHIFPSRPENSGPTLKEASHIDGQKDNAGGEDVEDRSTTQDDHSTRVNSSTVLSFLNFAESSILTVPFTYNQEVSQAQDTALTSNASTATALALDSVATVELQGVQAKPR